MYEDRRYQSYGSFDEDDQAYCTNGIIPPSVDGTHISLAAPTKIPCYDRDSSCHRTPQMSTHPDNKNGNCCKYLRNGFLKLTLIFFSYSQIVEYQIEEMTKPKLMEEQILENIPGRSVTVNFLKYFRKILKLSNFRLELCLTLQTYSEVLCVEES